LLKRAFNVSERCAKGIKEIYQSTQYQSEYPLRFSTWYISKLAEQDVNITIFDNMLPCVLVFCQTLTDEGRAVSQDVFPPDAMRTSYDNLGSFLK
jgi:hypothetical protein